MIGGNEHRKRGGDGIRNVDVESPFSISPPHTLYNLHKHGGYAIIVMILSKILEMLGGIIC